MDSICKETGLMSTTPTRKTIRKRSMVAYQSASLLSAKLRGVLQTQLNSLRCSKASFTSAKKTLKQPPITTSSRHKTLVKTVTNIAADQTKAAPLLLNITSRRITPKTIQHPCLAYPKLAPMVAAINTIRVNTCSINSIRGNRNSNINRRTKEVTTNSASNMAASQITNKQLTATITTTTTREVISSNNNNISTMLLSSSNNLTLEGTEPALPILKALKVPERCLLPLLPKCHPLPSQAHRHEQLNYNYNRTSN